MTKTLNIDVHPVTRVEGHGRIVINAANGTLSKCEWRVPEAPRFFEAMLRGRHFSEVARITSRICGICSVGHSLASVKATESALGMEVSEQTVLLRRLLKHGENFDSHVLHVYFLVAPDLVGAPSVFPLVPTHPEVVKRAIRMKKAGADWASLLGGRSTHPTRIVPGGFSALPTNDELKALRATILAQVPEAVETYKLLLQLAPAIPAFTRPTEYVALVDKAEYGLYDGKIGCLMPDGRKELVAVENYRLVTNEWVSPLSTAKHTKHALGSYMVGALARYNLSHAQLHPEAAALAKGLGLKAPCFNPYMNSIAQFVEAVHSAYTSVELIDKLLKKGIKDEKPVKPAKFGRGAGAVDVPRGILFHEYSYDDEGFCTAANCIIPTNQNHSNIQLDMEKMVPELMAVEKAEKDVRLALEMLVRAYDPCISCSTHYLDVEFE